jgi:hypothetical protein
MIAELLEEPILPSFIDFFRALWNHDPFPWQSMLAERVAGGVWPKALDLPTAAGKTACIEIALYALAVQADRSTAERTAPRRVWFVVDRRIVVDEAYERAEEIAHKLREAKDGPLREVADRLRSIAFFETTAGRAFRRSRPSSPRRLTSSARVCCSEVTDEASSQPRSSPAWRRTTVWCCSTRRTARYLSFRR